MASLADVQVIASWVVSGGAGIIAGVFWLLWRSNKRELANAELMLAEAARKEALAREVNVGLQKVLTKRTQQLETCRAQLVEIDPGDVLDGLFGGVHKNSPGEDPN